MLRLFLTLIVACGMLAPTCSFAAGTPTPDEAQAMENPAGTPKHYYDLAVTGMHRSELAYSMEVSVIDNYWAVATCATDSEELPVSFVAIRFGNDGEEFDFHGTPSALIPLLKHVRSGEMEAWYFTPHCDQLELKWTKTDLAHALVPLPQDDPAALVANPRLYRQTEHSGGSIAISL
jgi:hypothetical protein